MIRSDDLPQIRSKHLEVTDSDAPYMTIKIRVPVRVYHLWLTWQDRMKELDNDSKINAFEYALVEALNTPNEFYAEDIENED